MGVPQYDIHLGRGTLSVQKSGRNVLLVLDRLFSVQTPTLKDILLNSASITSRVLEEVAVSLCR